MKERMEDELWMRKLKERLEDYSEPLPVAGWERLEKDLPALKPLANERRIMPFRRWAVAAAAVLLIAVSSTGLWLLQSPVGDEVRNTAVPSLALAPDELPSSQEPGVQMESPETVFHTQRNTLRNGRNRNSLIAQQINVTEEKIEQEEIEQENITVQKTNIESTAQASITKETVTADVAEENMDKQVQRRRPSGRDKLHLPSGKEKRAKSRGWSVGLSVGNTGGLISGNDIGADNLMQNSPGSYGNKVDLSSMADGILNVPEGQELVFKDGMPYLLRSGNQIADIHHKQPLSFGFSVRKGLAKGFSVETGLTYTYLASDVEFARSSETVSQKLHYLGIPLRANWNFVDKKAFTMYISAGGAVEKCVYGKIGSDSETIKPLQLSVMGAVGAQYNISRRVGIYVEPGVSYFFDDGSKVETIRKENPLNFTLQGGIRLTY